MFSTDGYIVIILLCIIVEEVRHKGEDWFRSFPGIQVFVSSQHASKNCWKHCVCSWLHRVASRRFFVSLLAQIDDKHVTDSCHMFNNKLLKVTADAAGCFNKELKWLVFSFHFQCFRCSASMNCRLTCASVFWEILTCLAYDDHLMHRFTTVRQNCSHISRFYPLYVLLWSALACASLRSAYCDCLLGLAVLESPGKN